MSECPACGSQFRPDTYNFIDFESEQSSARLGSPFPEYIQVSMFENYVCYNCGSKMRIAISKAKYENPEISEIKSTITSE